MVESLRGKLLIAAPSLFDFFRRTVVLVLEHTPEGALGVVLNRASDVRVAEAVPALAELAGEGELVRLGGPVATEAVIALGDFADGAEPEQALFATLGVVQPQTPPTGLRRLRVYAGYAGWAAGQLDGELEQGAWIVEPASPDDPFRDDDLWPVALQRKGGAYALMATMPNDPSLN